MPRKESTSREKESSSRSSSDGRNTSSSGRRNSSTRKKESTVHLNTLRDLYIEELRDLYSAEDQLIQALPKMEKAASSPELMQAFRTHLRETQGHKRRLDEVFEALGMSPNGKLCKGMQGLIDEGEEAIKDLADPIVKDAALVAAAQRVEHYEIAGYGTVRTFADELGESTAKKVLQEILDEEGEADRKLTALAEGRLYKSGINEQAVSGMQ